MTFHFLDLDSTTRGFMLAELRFDVVAERVFMSTRLTPAGQTALPGVLLDAFEWGSIETITQRLENGGWIYQMEFRNTVAGEIRVRTPYNTPQALAEAVFNHYYMRAIARRAIAEDLSAVEVYRARSAHSPRPQSEARIGELIDPVLLLLDLRSGEPSLGIPSGPNSGLSVALPRSVAARDGEPDMVVDKVGVAVVWARKRHIRQPTV